MKDLVIFCTSVIILFSYSISTAASKADCDQFPAILDLVNISKDTTRTSIEAAVKLDIYNTCKQAGKRVNDEKTIPKFSVFSDTYDVHKDYYFCSNPKGYEAYKQQVTNFYMGLVEEEKRKYWAEYRKNNPSKAQPYPKPAEKELFHVLCRRTDLVYLPVVNKMKKEEEEAFKSAYPKSVCVPVE